MERVISATEARVRFGELMRKVVENQESVIVKRSGEPRIVVISVEEYERLKSGGRGDDWAQALERAIRLATRIETRRGRPPMPPPEDVIRETREDRNEQLLGLH